MIKRNDIKTPDPLRDDLQHVVSVFRPKDPSRAGSMNDTNRTAKHLNSDNTKMLSTNNLIIRKHMSDVSQFMRDPYTTSVSLNTMTK